jgi:hypothetical protein
MTYKCASVKNRKGKVVRKQCYEVVPKKGKMTTRFVKNSTPGCSCER